MLTKIRLFSVFVLPIFVLFCFERQSFRLFAASIYALIMFTDYLDGYLARKLDAQSDFGKCFDNIADKLINVAMLLVLVSQKRADVLPCMIIILREILVSGLREFLGTTKQHTVQVARAAKYKTAAQSLAIFLLLTARSGSAVANIGVMVLWVSAVLTMTTMYNYVTDSLKLFK